MKRMIAMILALALCLSVCSTAFAVDVPELSAETQAAASEAQIVCGTIADKEYDGEPIEMPEYSVYIDGEDVTQTVSSYITVYFERVIFSSTTGEEIRIPESDTPQEYGIFILVIRLEAGEKDGLRWEVATHEQRFEILHHVHDYTEMVDFKPANCISDGYFTFACSCGETIDELLPRNPDMHNGSLLIMSAVEPTCTEPGYTGDTMCGDCGRFVVVGETLPPLGHSMDVIEIVSLASCVSQGEIRTICSNCGISVTEMSPIDPDAHIGAMFIANFAMPTCTEDGYTGDMLCWDCGTVVTPGSVLEATGHDWDKGTVTRHPSCVTPGLKVYTCQLCGETMEEEIPVESYAHSGETVHVRQKDPTCTEAGYTGDLVCIDCGATMAVGQVIEPLGHDWDVQEGIVPTCVTPGTMVAFCHRCGESVTSELAPNPTHHEGKGELVGEKYSTCIEQGYTGDVVCELCGGVISTGRALPLTDHSWGADTVRIEPSCILPGICVYTCTVCGEEYVEELPIDPENHEDYELVNEKDPTCAEAGYTGDIVCPDCGAVILRGEYLSSYGHDWLLVYEETASCVRSYYAEYSCKTCGEEKKVKGGIDSNVHDGDRILVWVTPATCYMEGYSGDVRCGDCGELIESGVDLPMLPHTWDKGVVIQEPTTMTEGIRRYSCKYCKATMDEAIERLDASAMFTDLKPGAYYIDAVTWAVQNGITKGTTDTTFAPKAFCTRAQVVTFLWRAAGCPAPENADSPFTDVSAKAYYHDAVLWAVENGITKGTSATTFDPGRTCTRGMVVTFLWRLATAPSTASHPFTDVADAAYYHDAVVWAFENGITTGVADGVFAPGNTCTRSQVVSFLYRAVTGGLI